MSKENILQCPVIKGKVLGVDVYRGFLNLSDLSSISKADIYDSLKNPKGTQRDLSQKHAKDAYEYVKNNELGFWPEVFLCCRDNKAISFKSLSDEYPEIGVLEIDLNKVKIPNKVVISRVDGNHRLHYGNSKEKGYSKIDKDVSFCIAYNLKLNEEIKLFKDINKNQKSMNTSHLDGIDVRLSPAEELKRRQPELFIANKLNEDKTSALYERVYSGGKKPIGVDIPLRAIKSSLNYMFSKSVQLPRLNNVDAQYKVINNYFNAFKDLVPKAWETPKDYIVLRGVGLWAISYLGAQVIDRALTNGKFDKESLLKILKSGKSWDWSNKGDFVGFSGAKGAQEISNKVARSLRDEDQDSTEDLINKIINE